MARVWRLGVYLSVIGVIACCLFLISIDTTNAAINPQIPFYGTLVNASGTPLTGTYDMVFRFYDAASGGTLLDTSTHTAGNGNAVSANNGEFSVLLGSGTGNTLDGLDFNSATIYVGLTVESDSEMSPRQRLAAAPYAFNADTLDGIDSTTFLRNNATGSISASAVSSLLTLTQNGVGDLLNIFDGASEVFTVLDGGNVGVGSSTPIHTFSVGGDIFATGAFYDNNNNAGSSGMVLQSTGSGFVWVATTSLGFVGGATNISGLSDVNTAGAANGNVLLFNGSTWVDQATSSLGVALSDTTGTLAGNRGGTSLSTVAPNQLLLGAAGNTWIQVSTSSLNINAVTLNSLQSSQFLRSDALNTSGLFTGLIVTNATATTFTINGDLVSDLTGSGLTVSAGALTVSNLSSSSLNAGNWSHGYVLVASSTASGGFDWVATTTLGFGASNVSALSDLSDVDVTGAASGTILIADGSGNFYDRATSSLNINAAALGGLFSSQFLRSDALNSSGSFTNLSITNATTTSFSIAGDSFNDLTGSGLTVSGGVLTLDVTGNWTGTLDGLEGSQLLRSDTGNASGTISNFTFSAATGTTLTLGTDTITDFTGTGLSLAAGALTVSNLSSSSLNALHWTNRYILMASTTAPGGFDWVATSTLGIVGGNLWTQNGSSIYYSAGKVGIATSSPAQEFSVDADMLLTGAFYDGNNNPGTSGMVLQSNGSWVQWVSTTSLNIAGSGLFTDAGSFAYLTDTSDALVVGTSTRVNSSLVTFSTSSASALLTLSQHGTGRILDIYDASSTVFTIVDGGGVGIGTSTPDVELVVDGDFRLTGGLFDRNNTRGQLGQILQTTGAGLQWVSTSTLGLNDYTLATVVVGSYDSPNANKADYLATSSNAHNVIQQAINSLPTRGGVVYLLEGTYNIGNQIDLKSNVTLRGSGSTTLLRLQNSSPDNIAVLSAVSIRGVVISDIHIEGNKANNNLTDNQNGITFTNVSTSTINHVVANDFQDHGVQLTSSNGNQVINSRFGENENYAIWLNTNNVGNLVSGNISTNNGWRGVAVWTGSRNNIISHNVLVGNDVGIWEFSASNNTYIGNVLDNNSSNGMHFDSSSNSTIVSNNVSFSELNGIYVTNSSNLNVQGNTFDSNGGGISSTIAIDSTNDNVSVIANNIYATGTPKLINVMSNTSVNTQIANNQFDNPNQRSYITDSGSRTRYDQYDRTTLTSDTELAFSLFSIFGSSSAPLASSTQLGSGDIFALNNSSGSTFVVDNAGNVGIGTTSPAALLNVWGSVMVGTSSTPTLTVDAAANVVRIATNSSLSPSTTLSVGGTIGATNLLGGGTTLSTDANGNIIRTPSDQNLKTNIQTVEDALPKLLQLRGVTFEWIDKERFGDVTELGFIAQEVQKVLPEVVRDGGDYLSLNIPNMLAVVIESIKEIWAVVTNNTDRITELESENQQLAARLQVVESKLKSNNNTASTNHSSNEPNTTIVPEPEEPSLSDEMSTSTSDNQASSTVSEDESVTDDDEVVSEEDTIEPVVEEEIQDINLQPTDSAEPATEESTVEKSSTTSEQTEPPAS